MPEPRTSSSDDASVRVTLGSVNRMLDGIFAAPREWIAALEEHERPKVNDLIGDLLLLADALENALDSFKDRAHTRCGEEDSDDVSQ